MKQDLSDFPAYASRGVARPHVRAQRLASQLLGAAPVAPLVSVPVAGTDGTSIQVRERVSITMLPPGIADVRLARPQKMNALDPAMFAALIEVGEILKRRKGLRCVVLSGEGASFCAGLDLGSMRLLTEDQQRPDFAKLGEARITHDAQQVCWVWQELQCPVIAAVHGNALGGGLQIALGADIRIVHPQAKLSVREVYWGIIPDMTGTYFLSKLVRPDIAKDLVFTARVISGTRAGEIGLATEISENPYERAHALALEIAQRSPMAVRGAKYLLNRDNPTPAAQFAAEREVIESLIGTPDQREAVMANIAKRAAVFSFDGNQAS